MVIPNEIDWDARGREPGVCLHGWARRMTEGSSHLAGSFTPASPADLVQDDRISVALWLPLIGRLSNE